MWELIESFLMRRWNPTLYKDLLERLEKLVFFLEERNESSQVDTIIAINN